MPVDQPESQRGEEAPRVVSVYGIASAVLALVAVAAVVLAALIWNAHRGDTDERAYRTRVLQAAAEWTGVLINMNADSVDADLNTLHEGTVGQLNTDFEATVEPYRKLVRTLKARTTGQINAVAIETIHHDQPGAPPPAPRSDLSGLAARTDTVMVIATSVSENAGTEAPQTVRWTLRMDVSDVDGRLLISRLEPIR
ncbi:hypothetical protein [Mycolicibacterium chlorophenolicum]|uniref:Mce associated membrane protein n=1 Tax=Mycolicibacterium chlorophenolicum TaxID=37916 RepID=A0A0J6VMD9_9MYCO|nr:hypothetical protein [Mycolicibacterium chlorophenolicum]KMO70692.1 hypothetical protein MCHLDSM_05584 [Mycolicibacterium chlorophenolicum]